MRILHSTIERLLYYLLALVFVVAAVGIIYLIKANDRLSNRVQFLQSQIEQNHQIAEEQKALAMQLKVGIDNLNRHMDCIVEFFAQPNRLTAKITDIQNCTLQDITAPQPRPTPAPGNTNTVKTNPQSKPPVTTSQNSSPRRPGVPERVGNFFNSVYHKIVGFFK